MLFRSSAADVKTLYAAVDDFVDLGGEAVTLSGNTSVADANVVSAATSGVVTATISEGAMATLAGLSSDGQVNAYTITVTDTTGVSAAALNTLNGKTSEKVVVTAVNSISGSAADVKTLYASAAADFTGLGNEAVTLIGSTSVSDANEVSGATSGVVTATKIGRAHVLNSSHSSVSRMPSSA